MYFASENELKHDIFPLRLDSLDYLTTAATCMLLVTLSGEGGDIGELCKPQITSVFGTFFIASYTNLIYHAKDGLKRYIPAMLGAAASIAVEAAQELTRLGNEMVQSFGPGDINDVYSALAAGGIVAYIIYKQK